MCVCECAFVNADTYKAPKTVAVHLGLELTGDSTMNHRVSVLGMNSGPLQEQYLILTTEPSFQATFKTFILFCYFVWLACYVAEGDLGLPILLLLPSKCWDNSYVPP